MMVKITKENFDAVIENVPEYLNMSYLPNKENLVHSTTVNNFKVYGKRILNNNDYIEVLLTSGKEGK